MNIDKDTYNLSDHPDLKIKMLNWANRFSIFCLLDNNGYGFEDPAFECLLGAGCVRSFSFTEGKRFSEFYSFFSTSPSPLFGHLGYNAKGDSYKEIKKNESGFGDGFFFEPEIIVRLSAGKLEVLKTNIDPAQVLKEINETSCVLQNKPAVKKILPAISREQYLKDVAKLQHHIKRGDCYEINYCQNFVAEGAETDPVTTYIKLTNVSPVPFAALYKMHDNYCMCASPERFLKKTGTLLTSQPMKGTGKRDMGNPGKDTASKNKLQHSAKEKSENVMIADLVRNDLSIICEKNSVTVKELYGVYSFPLVHQMITTVEGTLAPQNNFARAIEACYPPGSMTGAPKKRVMELIEKYESYPRDLFSGSIGYITAEGDFDLNVVIRSIFYNRTQKKLSFFAGSGITFYSKAEDEYEECMLKAEAIITTLNSVS